MENVQHYNLINYIIKMKIVIKAFKYEYSHPKSSLLNIPYQRSFIVTSRKQALISLMSLWQWLNRRWCLWFSIKSTNAKMMAKMINRTEVVKVESTNTAWSWKNKTYWSISDTWANKVKRIEMNEICKYVKIICDYWMHAYFSYPYCSHDYSIFSGDIRKLANEINHCVT